MRKNFIILCLALPLGVHAQYLPDLSTKGMEVTLPMIRGWADDKHYIELKREDKQTVAYQINVETGERMPYAPPASTDRKDHLRIVDGDIMCNKECLFQTPEEEAVPQFSPDGKWVAFTRNNDLYAYELASGREIRYTTDGSEVIKNGYASWMYNEEILGRDMDYRAYWWSPDGKYLAFFRTDESMVPAFPIYNAFPMRYHIRMCRTIIRFSWCK